MKRHFTKMLSGLALAATFVLMGGSILAHDPSGEILADGITVYYSVIPAEMIRGYPKGSAEYGMHGGPPAGKHFHHVMVALFDAKSLERITDARVKAAVAEIGLAATVKKLEPMNVSNAMTYGNYFYFSSFATYKITIEILKAGSDKPIVTSFEYKHH